MTRIPAKRTASTNEAGDPHAGFAAFYAAAAPKLLQRAIMLGYYDDAGIDLMQDAMEIALRNWSLLRARTDGERFNYVKTTMIRNAIRSSKRAGIFRSLVARLWNQDDHDPIQFEALETVRTGEILREVIDALPKRQRFVVALLWDGYSIAEVAAEMNLTQSTVRSHLQHARVSLEARLTHREEGGDA
jgi:RNA polymerase sigma factor (sigma-70 family)